MKYLASCLLACGIALLPARALEIYNVLDAGVDPTGTSNAASTLASILSSTSPVHRTILIPKGATVRIDRVGGNALSIPADTRIILEGTIIGNSCLECAGSVTIEGGGKFMPSYQTDARTIKVYSGTIIVQNISFDGGSARPSGVVIMDDTSSPGKVVDSVLVTGCTANNWGMIVHRQAVSGGTSKVKRATISNNFAKNIGNGDAINWDGHTGLDSNVSIIGNTIDGVTSSWTTFSGMGICVAGNNFNTDGSMTMANAMSGVIIANNIVRNSFQGIHVEYCRDTLVTGNLVDGISTTNAPSVQDRAGGIVLYANWNQVVQGNTVQNVAADMTSPTSSGNVCGIFSGYGSGFAIGPKNVRIANNNLLNASIITQQIAAAGEELSAPTSLDIDDNRLRNGVVWVWARGDIGIRGNHVNASLSLLSNGSGATNAITINTSQWWVSSYLHSQTANIYNIQNNVARTDLGTPSFSLSDPDYPNVSGATFGNSRILASGNNFDLAQKPSSTLATISGDAFTRVSGATGQIYSSASKDWGSGHVRGQRIMLNSTTPAIVNYIFWSSAQSAYAMEVVSPTTGSLLDLTSIASGTITVP